MIIIMLVSGKIHLSTKFYVDQIQKKTREIYLPPRGIYPQKGRNQSIWKLYVVLFERSCRALSPGKKIF
jgi:hypothetical protein